jgi:hypothetical protein
MNVDEEEEQILDHLEHLKSPVVGPFDGMNSSCITTKSGATFSEADCQMDSLRIPQV